MNFCLYFLHVWSSLGEIQSNCTYCGACVTFVEIIIEVKNAFVKCNIFKSTTTSLSAYLIIPLEVNFLVLSPIKAPLTFLYIVVVNCLITSLR